MKKPRIAIISFPGNNCEVESMRAIKESDMDAVFFRWNDDVSLLKDIDGYFLPGGFSYEDRGRSGMVAARDPIMDFVRREAALGKAVIGNCNGAQVLVEAGLIPLGEHLDMSLARNAVKSGDTWISPGFLSEWIWVKPACTADRCATSGWTGAMHMPIAHGEGRFTTKDVDLIQELRKNDQIAFEYCDESGRVSEDASVTPNGAMHAIAGICNPAGNVVALMPHPERTTGGKPYFDSLRQWILNGKTKTAFSGRKRKTNTAWAVGQRIPAKSEVFIDTIIVNNEERTVEQAARLYAPSLRLKQWKYFAVGDVQTVLGDLTLFNPNKERAFIRRGDAWHRWSVEEKNEEELTSAHVDSLFTGTGLLRRDQPDTGAASLGDGARTGTCYLCSGVNESEVMQKSVLEVFANPHASTLERIL